MERFCERVKSYIDLYVKKCLSWKKISFNTILTTNIHLIIANLDQKSWSESLG